MASKQVMLNLTIDKSNNRVLFAEADTNFVDILLSFLTLPLGTIVGLTNTNATPCLNNLYKSAKDLGDKYIYINFGNEIFLWPRYKTETDCLDLAVNLEGDRALTYYACDQCCRYNLLSPFANTTCHCGDIMCRKVKFPRDMGSEGVFLKGMKRFIITDNFIITPSSTEVVMTLIGSLGKEQMSNIEERTIIVGRSEVITLLQRSLVSDNAFTDSFLSIQNDTTKVVDRRMDSFTVISLPEQPSADTTEISIQTKIIVDKHKNKVLYAEVNQNFIDLLLSFLIYPSGSVVKNLNKKSHLTCFDNLYASAFNPDISDSFINGLIKESVLDPGLPSSVLLDDSFIEFIFPKKKIDRSFIQFAKITPAERYYLCRNPDCDVLDISTVPNVRCKCDWITNKRMKIFDTIKYIDGFVQEATYMVTDDLVLTPLSVSTVTRLVASSKGGIRKVLLNIGQKEILLLLEAALSSKTALTDVLLNREETTEVA